MATFRTNAFKLNQMYELLVDDCIECLTREPQSGELWVWGRQEENGALGLNCADNCSDSKNQIVYCSLPSNLPGSSWYVCDISTLSQGSNAFSAAIKCDGTLWMWGANCYGQLGQGNSTHRSSPVQVPGTQWKCVSTNAGGHILSMKNDGTLWAWGWNQCGQLGNNSTNNSDSPIQIPGTQWCDIAAGGNMSFGLKCDGTLWAWGNGGFGSLGQNCAANSSSPIQIPGTQWFGIFSKCNSNGAIKCDGTLWMWGLNQRGQLGQNNTVCYSSPVQVPGTQWKSIAVNEHTLAIKTDGTLWAWGRGQYNAIGDGNQAERSSPIQIPGTQWCRAEVNSATTNTSYALKTDGTLWIWGWNNVCCNYGITGTTHYSSPTQVTGRQWSNISANDSTIFGIEQNINTFDITAETPFKENNCGNLWVWGSNNFGELGQNSLVLGTASSPIQIPGTNWWKFSKGISKFFAIKGDCTLWAWGANHCGSLGDNTTIHRSSPVQIPGTAWCQVAAGDQVGHAAAIKTDNTLWIWGQGICGALGLNDLLNRSSPTQIPGTQWCCIIIGNLLTYALKTDGTLWAWGENANGQLGDNTRIGRSSPVQIPGTQWSAIRPATTGARALKSDGTLWSWGSNGSGAVGDNTKTNRSSPVQIPGTQWCRMSTGPLATYALKCDGTLWTWGTPETITGTLANNCTIDVSSPIQIPGTQWYRVDGRQRGATALLKNGELWGWGRTSSGEFINCPCTTTLYVCVPWRMSNPPTNGVMKLGSSSFYARDGADAIIKPTLPL
jgi:alpha-tubulin suppressor-like RCC1 family protein